MEKATESLLFHAEAPFSTIFPVLITSSCVGCSRLRFFRKPRSCFCASIQVRSFSDALAWDRAEKVGPDQGPAVSRGIFRRFDCPELRLTQDVSRRSPPLIHESGQPQYAAAYLLGRLESWGLGFSAHRDF